MPVFSCLLLFKKKIPPTLIKVSLVCLWVSIIYLCVDLYSYALGANG